MSYSNDCIADSTIGGGKADLKELASMMLAGAANVAFCIIQFRRIRKLMVSGLEFEADRGW
jgi:hypothetical protein